MRIALLADVHANFDALEAVVADIADQEIDVCWFLGDIVGYGPEPAECLQWLAQLVHAVEPDGWVLGNHDAMLARLLFEYDLEALNHTPREAIELNRQALAAAPVADAFWRSTFTDDRAHPRRHTLDDVDYTLVHARQANGRYFHVYVYPWDADYQAQEFMALAELGSDRPQVQVFGHSHVPTLIQRVDGGPCATPVEPFVPYLLGEMALVNPGSVGQPRDLDKRAAYATLDTATRTVVFRRVAYDWQRTVRLLAAGRYPAMLGLRLMNADPPGTARESRNAPWLAHFERVAGRTEP